MSAKIAHPNEVKTIARAKIKTDKRDSEGRAHRPLPFLGALLSALDAGLHGINGSGLTDYRMRPLKTLIRD